MRVFKFYKAFTGGVVLPKSFTCVFAFFIAYIFTLKLDVTNCQESFHNDSIINHIYPITLFSSIANEKDHFNLLSSPLALRYSLLAAAFVAHGNTRDDLEKLLFTTTYKDLLENFKFLKNERGWKVRVYVQKNLDVTQCVQKWISEFKEFINYSNAGAASDIINSWVQHKTKNAVPQITLPKFNRGYINFLTLTHVEYFETTWEKHFVNIFPKGDKSTGEVFKGDMLHQDNVFLYGKLKDLDVTAVELPLNKNARMVVLQPLHYTKNFENLKEALKKVDVRRISSRLKETEISVYFPILKAIKMDRSMTQAMNTAYGVTEPFHPESADFRKLHSCGDETFIRLFNQRSRINVNAKEVRVGSATGLQWSYPHFNNTIISDGEEDDDAGEEEMDDVNDGEEQDRKVAKYSDVDDINAVVHNRIVIEPKKNLPKVILVRPFFYAIIRDDTPLWFGTIVKPHNIDRRF